uniref:Uncharacterized protein n=1 Tax=Eutreptiella gymnastica TaxID=73025 RepID=A0A7S1IPK7_9EUGL
MSKLLKHLVRKVKASIAVKGDVKSVYPSPDPVNDDQPQCPVRKATEPPAQSRKRESLQSNSGNPRPSSRNTEITFGNITTSSVQSRSTALTCDNLTVENISNLHQYMHELGSLLDQTAARPVHSSINAPTSPQALPTKASEPGEAQMSASIFSTQDVESSWRSSTSVAERCNGDPDMPRRLTISLQGVDQAGKEPENLFGGIEEQRHNETTRNADSEGNGHRMGNIDIASLSVDWPQNVAVLLNGSDWTSSVEGSQGLSHQSTSIEVASDEASLDSDRLQMAGACMSTSATFESLTLGERRKTLVRYPRMSLPGQGQPSLPGQGQLSPRMSLPRSGELRLDQLSPAAEKLSSPRSPGDLSVASNPLSPGMMATATSGSDEQIRRHQGSSSDDWIKMHRIKNATSDDRIKDRRKLSRASQSVHFLDTGSAQSPRSGEELDHNTRRRTLLRKYFQNHKKQHSVERNFTLSQLQSPRSNLGAMSVPRSRSMMEAKLPPKLGSNEQRLKRPSIANLFKFI